MKDSKSATKKELRKELGEFTEEVLLPSMQKIFVTKEEAKNFATKDDLKGMRREMGEVFATKNELMEMKEEIKRGTIRGTDKLITKADEIIKKLDEKKVEDIAGTEAYKRHDEKLEEHEERITELETKVI